MMPESLSLPPSRHVVAASLILIAVGLTFYDLVSGKHDFATTALALVLAFILLGWRMHRSNARVMLVMAAATGVGCLATDVTGAEFATIASRTMYLPALVAVMTVLRVAAERSPMVTGAGHFVVEQPPSRRFGLLAIGSQIFGVLLNVGGFLLLLNIALRTVRETAPDERVREIQTRRVVNATLRGFAPGIYWSPLGVAINLLLPIFPALTWLGFLPYGLGALVLYLAVSWAFDFLEPRAKVRRPKSQSAGGPRDLLGLLATLVVIAGASGIAEVALGVPLRAAILFVVPTYATFWALANRRGQSVSTTLGSLVGEAGRLVPKATNEICVMTASGFVGLALAAMIPSSAVEAVVSHLGLSPGVLAVSVAWAILGLSIVGISPVITGTLFVAAIAGVGIDMPDAVFMLAALVGWSSAVIVSPMTATIAIASSALDRSATEIGLRWNGATAVTILAIASVALLILY